MFNTFLFRPNEHCVDAAEWRISTAALSAGMHRAADNVIADCASLRTQNPELVTHPVSGNRRCVARTFSAHDFLRGYLKVRCFR